MPRIVGLILLGLVLALEVCSCGQMPELTGDTGVFDNPVGLAVHWPYAYVTCANFDLSGDKRGKLNVVDLRLALTKREKSVIFGVKTDPYLGKIIMSPDGKRLYATDRRHNSVLYFDLSDPARPKPIDLDAGRGGVQGVTVSRQPFGLALSPDGKSLWVACMSAGNVTIIDLASNRIAQTIPLTSGANEVAFDPSGAYAYVTSRWGQEVAIVDAHNGEIIATFNPGPTQSVIGFDNRALAFTPDGRYLFIAARKPSSLLMLDTDKLPLYPQRAVLRTLPTDAGPTGVAITPDGGEVWVCCYDSNTIFVFNTQNGELIKALQYGDGPYDIKLVEDADHPGHLYAVITNFTGFNLSLIDATTKEVVWAIP